MLWGGAYYFSHIHDLNAEMSFFEPKRVLIKFGATRGASRTPSVLAARHAARHRANRSLLRQRLQITIATPC